jgi:putative glycosyltransferase (TIGR04372 family)
MRFIIDYCKKKYICRIIYHLIRWVCIPRYRREWDFIYVVDWKYHSIVSARLAFLLLPLLSIFRKFFINRNILFSISNISHAIGHVYPEVDALVRMRSVGLIDQNKIIYYVYPRSPVLSSVKLIFEKFCIDDHIRLLESGFINLLLAPLLLRYPELTVSSSISSMDFSLNSKGKFSNPLEFGDVIKFRMSDYAKLRTKTRSIIPFRVSWPLPDEMQKYIGTLNYIVIQIKTEAVNGTLAPVNPDTYLEAIRRAKHYGYEVVLGGREKMPESFQREGVINYSSSKFASPLNDFLLVLNSNGVIGSASGFCFLADIIDKPLLTLNCWHIAGYPGIHTIAIPSRVRYKGVLLSLPEQFEFAIQHGQNIHQLESCEAVDASSQDIVDGFEELMHLIKGKEYQDSKRHKEFRKLFSDGPLPIQDSVISEKYLERNIT